MVTYLWIEFFLFLLIFTISLQNRFNNIIINIEQLLFYFCDIDNVFKNLMIYRYLQSFVLTIFCDIDNVFKNLMIYKYLQRFVLTIFSYFFNVEVFF